VIITPSTAAKWADGSSFISKSYGPGSILSSGLQVVILRRPRNQGTPRRTEFGHGAFREILSAVRLGLQLPCIFRLLFGLRAGRSSPARAPRSGAGRGAGGETPPPQRFLRSCWAGEGPWACQKGQIGQKMVRFEISLVKTSR
jgi:hypothetical protein